MDGILRLDPATARGRTSQSTATCWLPQPIFGLDAGGPGSRSMWSRDWGCSPVDTGLDAGGPGSRVGWIRSRGCQHAFFGPDAGEPRPRARATARRRSFTASLAANDRFRGVGVGARLPVTVCGHSPPGEGEFCSEAVLHRQRRLTQPRAQQLPSRPKITCDACVARPAFPRARSASIRAEDCLRGLRCAACLPASKVSQHPGRRSPARRAFRTRPRLRDSTTQRDVTRRGEGGDFWPSLFSQY